MALRSVSDTVCHFLRQVLAWKGITRRHLMSGEAPVFPHHGLSRINLLHQQPNQAHRQSLLLRQEVALRPSLLVLRRPSDNVSGRGRTKQRKQDPPLPREDQQLHQPVELDLASRQATVVPTASIPVRPRRRDCKRQKKLSSRPHHHS